MNEVISLPDTVWWSRNNPIPHREATNPRLVVSVDRSQWVRKVMDVKVEDRRCFCALGFLIKQHSPSSDYGTWASRLRALGLDDALFRQITDVNDTPWTLLRQKLSSHPEIRAACGEDSKRWQTVRELLLTRLFAQENIKLEISGDFSPFKHPFNQDCYGFFDSHKSEGL